MLREKIDALNAIKLSLCEDSSSFKKYDLIYRTSNENVTGICSAFDIKDKDVLTVCGSGDQYLSFILYGAKIVDVFDINKLSIYYLVLKQTGIITLPYNEFIDFFVEGTSINPSNIRKEYFNNKTYKKISGKLPRDVKNFWNSIFMKSFSIFNTFDEKSLFIESYSRELFFDIPFLNEQKYYELRSKFSPNQFPLFFNSDVKNLLYQENKKYDLIYLSNIADYEFDLNRWVMFIMLELRDMLKENGTIVAHYRWFPDVEEKIYDYYGFKKEQINKERKDIVYTYKVGNYGNK